MQKIRNLADILKKFPSWITVPLLVVEIIVVVLMLSWVYFTRAVGTVVVPDLRGKNFEEVKNDLSSKDLNYRTEWKSSLYTPKNKILSQVPGPGTEIKENRPVTLFISKGPQYVSTPDLRGRSLIEARSLLEQETSAGENPTVSSLVIGNIARVYSDRQPSEHIITQSPPPGRKVLSGSRIDVLISKGGWPKRTVVPMLGGKKLEKAEKLLSEAGLKKGSVRYVYRQKVKPNVVLEQTPPPSVLVRENQPVSLTVNLNESKKKPDFVRYTTIRINPPLEVSPGRLRVELVDRRGRDVIFENSVEPGEKVEFLTTVKGTGNLIIYWNDELYQFRQLKS